MKRYICDGCKKESLAEEDIPEYKMFVCDNYDGYDVMLCNRCEKRIREIMEGKSPDPNIGKVRPCHNSTFHEYPCLEDDERYGFFKNAEDIRPSSCTWIKKEDAERIYKLFTE